MLNKNALTTFKEAIDLSKYTKNFLQILICLISLIAVCILLGKYLNSTKINSNLVKETTSPKITKEARFNPYFPDFENLEEWQLVITEEPTDQLYQEKEYFLFSQNKKITENTLVSDYTFLSIVNYSVNLNSSREPDDWSHLINKKGENKYQFLDKKILKSLEETELESNQKRFSTPFLSGIITEDKNGFWFSGAIDLSHDIYDREHDFFSCKECLVAVHRIKAHAQSEQELLSLIDKPFKQYLLTSEHKTIPRQKSHNINNTQGEFSFATKAEYLAEKNDSYLFLDKPSSGLKGFIALKENLYSPSSSLKLESYATPGCANVGCSLIDQVIILPGNADPIILPIYGKGTVSFLDYSSQAHPWVNFSGITVNKENYEEILYFLDLVDSVVKNN